MLGVDAIPSGDDRAQFVERPGCHNHQHVDDEEPAVIGERVPERGRPARIAAGVVEQADGLESLADGIVTHIDRESVDPVLARDQWEAYVGALRANGWDIVQAPAAPDCPDGVFIEDQVLVYGDLAVICRPGAVSRRAETAAVEVAVREQGYSPADSRRT